MKYHGPVLGALAMAVVVGAAVAIRVLAAVLTTPWSFDDLRFDAVVGALQPFDSGNNSTGAPTRDG